MPLDLKTLFDGAVVMAPMTKGSNLPYRRLCDELGATVTMGEMAVSRKLQKNNNAEFALLRRHPGEKVFGVQLAGRTPEELEWATALAVERGADLVDLNCGCPIHDMTRRGLGSALLQKPGKLRGLVEAMKRGAGEVPVTVKIRLGWSERELVHLKIAQAAVDGGADALIVHGRTRTARYRQAADWDRIGEVVAALEVPVLGNGDILWPGEITAARQKSGAAGVMIARGALIKPWIFREAQTGQVEDPTAEERLEIYATWVRYALEHWGDDERGRSRVARFLRWHLDFWTRYLPPTPEGELQPLQEREEVFRPRSEIEAFLRRADEAALDWWERRLLEGEEAAGPLPEPPAEAPEPREAIPEG